MEYKTHIQAMIDTDGTSLQGYITTTYDALVAAFGYPTESDGYKVDWEWEVWFDDGTVATIYNWKNGPNYCGRDGLHCDQITEWHVGGHTPDAVNHVARVMHPQVLEVTA